MSWIWWTAAAVVVVTVLIVVGAARNAGWAERQAERPDWVREE